MFLIFLYISRSCTTFFRISNVLKKAYQWLIHYIRDYYALILCKVRFASPGNLLFSQIIKMVLNNIYNYKDNFYPPIPAGVPFA